ncbi:MAG: YfhO family protein [Phototrophicaceae bacterium]
MRLAWINRYADWLLVGVLVLLLQPLLLPSLPTQALDGSDFTGNVYPLYGYTAEHYRDGLNLHWNPYQFAGFPVTANPQAAVFYPATWAVWLIVDAFGVSVPRVIGWMVVLHTLIGAVGMARLTRAHGANALGGGVAGVIFVMGGWWIARIYAGHYTMLTAVAWVPWLLHAYQVALDHNRGWHIYLAPMGWLGLMCLAGHPQMVLYACLLLGGTLVWRWLTHPCSVWEMVKMGAQLALIGVGAVGLGMMALLPTAQLIRFSPRADATLEMLNEFALPPVQLLTLVLPNLFGHPKVQPLGYWGVPTFEEMSAYVGVLPLVALLLTPVLAKRGAKVGYWVVWVIVGLLLALGRDGGLFTLLVRWVPGFDLFRAPARYLFFWTFGMCGIMAWFVTLMQQNDSATRQAIVSHALRPLVWVVGGLAIIAVLLIGGYALVPQDSARVLQFSSVLMGGVFWLCGTVAVLWLLSQPNYHRLAMLAVVAWVGLDVWRVADLLITLSPIQTGGTIGTMWETIQQTFPADAHSRLLTFVDGANYYANPVNGATLTKHLHVRGYDPLELTDYIQAFGTAYPDPNHPFHTLMGVRYVVSDLPREDEGWELLREANGFYFYERETPFPRAWVITNGILEPDPQRIREAWARAAVDFDTTAMFTEPLSCEMGDGTYRATITDYRPSTVEIAVSGTGGVLVLSDQMYPGWEATVDGEPVPIGTAWTFMRAVCVPDGEHVVTFRFVPRVVWVGMGISLLAWMGWGIALVLRRGV